MYCILHNSIHPLYESAAILWIGTWILHAATINDSTRLCQIQKITAVNDKLAIPLTTFPPIPLSILFDFLKLIPESIKNSAVI